MIYPLIHPFFCFLCLFQVNTIPGIEEVNMIKDDGSVIHFNNPKVQASLGANTFAVTGHAENKQITELLPGKNIIATPFLFGHPCILGHYLHIF